MEKVSEENSISSCGSFSLIHQLKKKTPVDEFECFAHIPLARSSSANQASYLCHESAYQVSLKYLPYNRRYRHLSWFQNFGIPCTLNPKSGDFSPISHRGIFTHNSPYLGVLSISGGVTLLRSTYLDSSRRSDSNGTIIFPELAKKYSILLVPTIALFQDCTGLKRSNGRYY